MEKLSRPILNITLPITTLPLFISDRETYKRLSSGTRRQLKSILDTATLTTT